MLTERLSYRILFVVNLGAEFFVLGDSNLCGIHLNSQMPVR